VGGGDVGGGPVGGGDAHTHTVGQRITFGVMSASLPKSAYVQSEQGKPLAVDWRLEGCSERWLVGGPLPALQLRKAASRASWATSTELGCCSWFLASA
jgi:hypothetical protein